MLMMAFAVIMEVMLGTLLAYVILIGFLTSKIGLKWYAKKTKRMAKMIIEVSEELTDEL